MFSKNGLNNNYPFMIVYSQLIEGPSHYGNKEGRVTEKMVDINAKGDKGLRPIKETPFYRK